MLPVIDSDGEATARPVVLLLLLIPVGVLPRVLGMAGPVYAIVAVAAGIGMTYFGALMRSRKTAGRARAVLVALGLYLPLVLSVMVLDGRLS